MKKILFSLFLIFVTLALHAQNNFWQKTIGPYGSEGCEQLKLIAANNGTLYAMEYNGITGTVYRSSDNGLSWKELEYLLTDSLVLFHSLNIAQSGNFYAEDFTLNWKKSTDEGKTWALLPVPEFLSYVVETNTGTLIAWDIQSNKIHRSTNQGQTWSLIASMPISDINHSIDLEVSPLGGVIIAKTDKIILNKKATYLSYDDGQSWSRITVDYDYDLAFVSTTGASFFKKNGGLLRMSAVGQPLELVSSLYLDGFTMLPSGRILASNLYDSMHYSDDDGLSWHELQSDSDASLLQNVAPLSDSTLYCFVHGALSRSEDGGSTWQFSGYGIRKGKITQMKVISDSNYVAFTDFGLWKTENGGLNWDLLASTKKGNNLRYFELLVTGGIVSIHNKKLYYSDSLSGTFEDITPNQAQLTFSSNKVYVNPANNHFYLTTNNGHFRSEDLGQSWVQLPNLPYIRYVSFHPSGRIIANSNKKIYYSDTNGQTWIEVNNPLPNSLWIDRTWVAPNGGIFLTSYLGADYDFIAYSDDLAETWQVTGHYPQLGIESSAVAIALNNHVYATTYDHTYLSVSKGQTWQTLPCPESPAGPSCQRGVFLNITHNYRLFLQTEAYDCYITSAPVTQGAYIDGYVRVDSDADCSTPDAQAPLKNRILKADGESYNYFTNTDPDGHYIFFVDTGAYQVSVQNPSSIWWDYCEDSISVNLPELFVTDTADFAAIPLSFCPLMTVNVAIPILRRCFDNEVYVEYCNQGTEPADSAWVDVMLDPYLSFVSSAQPHDAQPNNTIRFFVGNIPSGDCSQFQLTVHVDCDSTVVGQTHCVTAHGFPDTLCTALPSWSGANIEASVVCQDTTVQFHLKNTGSSPSQILDFIIIEDDIVLLSGQESYDIAEELVLDVSANGSTWRIESEQEPGHPFSTLALAFTEGCGGFSSLGYVNQFTVNGITPSWHRMCVENTGSFDPNDKQGFPTGTGSEHNIRPGQAIDYLIRFQNTGTDTAFTVVIRDTLSKFLDPLSIRTGASSHANTWDLSGEGVITFSFNNILLPDSNINEAASHGFIQFSIDPYTTTPLGSVIENDAAIYFDFNEPVITNTTWHTLEKSPLISATRPEPQSLEPNLDIWPNPFNERTNIHVGQKTSGTLIANIYNSQGALVAQKSAVGPDIELSGKQLPSGLYWIDVRNTKAEIVGKGKLLRQ